MARTLLQSQSWILEKDDWDFWDILHLQGTNQRSDVDSVLVMLLNGNPNKKAIIAKVVFHSPKTYEEVKKIPIPFNMQPETEEEEERYQEFKNNIPMPPLLAYCTIDDEEWKVLYYWKDDAYLYPLDAIEVNRFT